MSPGVPVRRGGLARGHGHPSSRSGGPDARGQAPGQRQAEVSVSPPGSGVRAPAPKRTLRVRNSSGGGEPAGFPIRAFHSDDPLGTNRDGRGQRRSEQRVSEPNGNLSRRMIDVDDFRPRSGEAGSGGTVV